MTFKFVDQERVARAAKDTCEFIARGGHHTYFASDTTACAMTFYKGLFFYIYNLEIDEF